MAALASKCNSQLANTRHEKSKSTSFTDLFNMNRSTADSFNADAQKSPFLPKLPKKVIAARLSETHLINDYFVEPDNRKEQNQSQFSRKLKVDFKGDLLKASQVYLALNSNMSGSMKHVKTSDTPWAKNSTKTGKSAVSKNRVETSSFIRGTISRMNAPSSQSMRTISSYNTDRKNKNSLSKSKLPNKLFAELEKEPVKIQKFAEDLLNDHYRKSISKIIERKDVTELVKKPESDIALHVYNMIWEFHSYALKNSPYLTNLLEEQSALPETSDIKIKIKESKESTRTNIGKDYLDKMTHLFIEIKDPVIDKHSFAVALGNLYHPETIEVPSKLAGGVLAAAYMLKFNSLIDSTVDKISNSLSKKTISYYYLSASKYNEKRAMELCEKWLEMHLVPYLGTTTQLRELPLDLLTKTIKSNRFFTINEFNNFMTIINWIFLNLNPQIKELPNESMIITYFSSYGKEKTLLERYPELKDALYSVRLYGITKSNNMNTIQQMNIYPPAYIVKIMMEIQNSLTHGGDMAINRIFETSAIRQGFVIESGQSYCSEVFSLYGFHFELIAEKIPKEEYSKNTYQFYIQRLSTNDPILTYEQSQLETFSLRNDRYCNYSISVQYWFNGDQIYHTTGLKKQRFGKAKTQTTASFYLDIPIQNDDEIPLGEIFIQYSFIFPTD